MSIGQSRQRIEAPAKLRGEARYAADNYPAGVLHAVTVGTSVAAGRIDRIDAAAALTVPGVVRVLTASDLTIGDVSPPAAVLHMPMRGDWIEWEGQPLAIVLAETIEAAEEGARMVRVAATPVPPVVVGHGAVEPGPADYLFKARDAKGDVEAGLAGAAVKIDCRYSQPARHHNPMETSATVAAWDGDRLTLWDAVQAALLVPPTIASALRIPPENIRVVALHTGGGFGCKGYIWPHQILAAAASRAVGRPVRLQLTRAQQYAQVGYQALTRQRLVLGADRAGSLIAIRHEATNTTAMADTHFEAAAEISRALYACPNISIDQGVERVNANVPTPMRAPVEGLGSWALESAMDELAHALNMDPVDLRLANFAERHPTEDKPWSSNKLRECYAEGARLFGWRERASLPRQDGVWTLGRGMATATMGCFRFPSRAGIRLSADGLATVETSAQDIGTGLQTVLCQIAAETLGVPTDSVRVRWGDTRLPLSAGVFGSNSTMTTGGAVQLAAEDARRKLAALSSLPNGPLDIAAILRAGGVSEVMGDGVFKVPTGEAMSIDGAGSPWAMRTWGTVFVEVGVDRDLGLVRLRRLVGSYSAGRIINPLTARGQMIGSMIWEWGKATMEQSRQDPAHGRWLDKNLSNVAIPVNADIPSDITIHFADEHDPHASPTGARGIGELGATGLCAAVANAVYDAVGVRIRDLPISPGKILEASS